MCVPSLKCYTCFQTFYFEALPCFSHVIITHTIRASQRHFCPMSHPYISEGPVLTAMVSQPVHFFTTYSHPCQMQHSSLKIYTFVYWLHICSVHLVMQSHVGVFNPTRVKDKVGCAVMLQTTYVATHCTALATPGCSGWHCSCTLCGEFRHALYDSNTPHHQWMDPLPPEVNDRLLPQSSEKLGMPRKTVDIEDSYFSWRKYNYGRIQLPGFLEMLSMSPASCKSYYQLNRSMHWCTHESWCGHMETC